MIERFALQLNLVQPVCQPSHGLRLKRGTGCHGSHNSPHRSSLDMSHGAPSPTAAVVSIVRGIVLGGCQDAALSFIVLSRRQITRPLGTIDRDVVFSQRRR